MDKQIGMMIDAENEIVQNLRIDQTQGLINLYIH